MGIGVLERRVTEAETAIAAGLGKFRPGFLQGVAEFGGVCDKCAAKLVAAHLEADFHGVVFADIEFELNLGLAGLAEFFEFGREVFQDGGCCFGF